MVIRAIRELKVEQADKPNNLFVFFLLNLGLTVRFKGWRLSVYSNQVLETATKTISKPNCNPIESENQIDQGVDAELSSSGQEDLDYLKTAVINDHSIDVVKSKLAATSKFRRQLIRNNHSIDLLENFPYFFHTPALVTSHFL